MVDNEIVDLNKKHLDRHLRLMKKQRKEIFERIKSELENNTYDTNDSTQGMYEALCIVKKIEQEYKSE